MTPQSSKHVIIHQHLKVLRVSVGTDKTLLMNPCQNRAGAFEKAR